MAYRGRYRVGRVVAYTPTAAEATADGDGPWPAQIVRVNADDTVDLRVFPTVPAAPAAVLADPIVTSPNGSDAATTQTLANELKVDVNVICTLVNELRAALLLSTRTSVAEGGTPGTFAFESPDAP